MSNNKFTKFFGRSHLPGKNQIQGLLSGKIMSNMKETFEGLTRKNDIEHIRKIGEHVLYRAIYFSNHADIFYKFTKMSEEEFKIRITGIKNEIEEFIKFGNLKDVSKIQIFDDWLVALEKLLDQRLLYPLDQQCQEMYSLILRHLGKFQSFDARSPEDLKVFLQEIRASHRVAKSQLEAYCSGEADIRVKDEALTTLRKVNNILKSLKEALSKQLSEVRESANKLQREFDQTYHDILPHAEEASIFAGEDPEEINEKLDKIKERCLVAKSQIEKYLSGADNSEDRKCKSFELLEKSLADIKDIEKNLILVFDTRSRVNDMNIELQKSYEWLFQYAEQSQYFANQEPRKFKEDLKRIKNSYTHASSYIEKYLSGKYKDEKTYKHALKETEKYFGEFKKIKANLGNFLLKKLNERISQKYYKLIKHVEQSPRFTSEQQQNFINDLKNMDRRRQQAASVVDAYLTETGVSEKKSEAFRVLEEIEQDLDLSLANEINTEIMHRRNHLDKYQHSMAAEEREQGNFKERLERIENQRKHANAKLKPYFSGDGISEEDKHIAFETLEECLEETKVVEIEMTPFFKGPLIEKIDQSYAKLVQGESKSPIFTKQELQELNQHIHDIKELIAIDNKINTLSVENFNELSKLERRISLYLRLQMLHNNHIKISNPIKKYLDTITNFDTEEKKKIRNLIEQNIVNANNKFEKVKEVLKENKFSMCSDYLRESSLNEYNKSIESLRKY
jgi:hypothetical protein